MIRIAFALLLVACSSPSATEPRWFIARTDLTASDGVSMRHGTGVQIVERRGDTGRTSEGHWLAMKGLHAATPADSAAKVPPASVLLPPELATNERWIDVDIDAQRLTAYEGERPLRAFAISTGIGNEHMPFSTPHGTHRIYAKLRSTTMASAPDDPHPYRFEAVPHVQYFDREIALHGAYWHHRFGERVSHGCVNLAPPDAAWLFEFTAPHLAAGEREHAGRSGTLVRVR